jgi:hypothetical protein
MVSLLERWRLGWAPRLFSPCRSQMMMTTLTRTARGSLATYPMWRSLEASVATLRLVQAEMRIGRLRMSLYLRVRWQ